MQISRVAAEIPQALSILFNQIVYDLKRAGHDVITLSLGEAFFDIPLFDFTPLDHAKIFHYSESRGLPELRQRIADYYLRQYQAPVDPASEVLISNGGKPAIYEALLTAVNPGDEVLIWEPAWLSYQEQVRLVHGEPRFVPYDARIADLDDYFSPRTRVLIINNPNNPAGRLYTAEELSAIHACCLRHSSYLLVDEVYSDFVGPEERFISLATLVPDKQGVIVVNSWSKNMGMSGWRIGYVIAQREFIGQLLKVHQHILTCASTILLHYCAHYFDEILELTLPQVQAVVERRRRVAGMLTELRLTALPGSSTFYFFVNIGDYPGSSFDFALQLLLDSSVAVVPGSAYGASTDRFVRVSIGAESEERIWQALQLLKNQTLVTKVERRQLMERMRASPSMQLSATGWDEVKRKYFAEL